MFKKVIISLTLLSLLSGCFGSGGAEEDFSTLKKQAKSDNFEVLVEVRKDLLELIDSGENVRKSKKLLSDVENKMSENIKENIDLAFSNHDLKNSLEYAKIYVDLNPDDEEGYEVLEMMEKNYELQKEFDDFSEFTKEKYKELYLLTSEWNNSVRNVLINNQDTSKTLSMSKDYLIQISTIKKEIQDSLLNYSNDIFFTTQESLLSYVSDLEINLTNFIESKQDPEKNDSSIKDLVDVMSENEFSNVFVSIQKDVVDFLNEIDGEGNKVNNIEGNLNFNQINDDSSTNSSDDEEETEDQKED